jgi:hypothetical protein
MADTLDDLQFDFTAPIVDEVCKAAGIDPEATITTFNMRDVVASIASGRTKEAVVKLLATVPASEWGEMVTASGRWADDLSDGAREIESEGA